jgi:hypothetical protein
MPELIEQLKVQAQNFHIDLKNIPDNQKWVAFYKILEKKGFIVKYFYGGEQYGTPVMVHDEKNGISTVIPDTVKIYKRSEYGEMFVTEVRRAQGMDPTLEESISLFDLLTS